jgi:hypothetical protein
MTNQPYDGGSYEGGPYEGYNPYRDPQQPHQAQPQPQAVPQAPQAQEWPGQQPHAPAGHDQSGYAQGGYAQSGYDALGHPQTDSPHHGPPQTAYDPSGTSGPTGYEEQPTQHWQGQTWETQLHTPLPSAAAEETAYLPTASGYTGSQAPDAPHGHPQPQPPQAQAQPQAPSTGQATADPGYGAATVVGNPRVTDAQRARMEGRSPIIEPGMQPAALTALLGLLLAGTAAVGSYALVVPLVVLQAVTAAGWFRLNGMWPARQGIALAFAGALTADVALLVAGREHAPAAILGPLGLWVLLALVLQLRSHADPDERMYGLMATVAATALAVIATGYLGADPHAVSVGATAVAVAVLARALPLPTPASVVVSLLAAAGAGIAVGGMTGLGAKGALLGLAAGVCALVGHRAASYDYPSRFVHFTAGVALPLSAAAPAVWILGLALG